MQQIRHVPSSSTVEQQMQAEKDVRRDLEQQARDTGQDELVHTISVVTERHPEDPEDLLRVTGTIGDDDTQLGTGDVLELERRELARQAKKR